MKDDNHSMTKHPRGSSPPDNVEQIYRSWLQRLPVLREEPATQKPSAPEVPDGTGSDALNAAHEKEGQADSAKVS